MCLLDTGAHPYLLASLSGVGLLATVYVLASRQRRMILLSGLLATPLVPAAATANDDYWRPVRLGELTWGIEDVLFTFVVGSLAWFLAAWPFSQATSAGRSPAAILQRFAVFYATSVAGYLGLWLSGVDALASGLVVHGAVVTVVLARRRSLWPMAAVGLLGSAASYFLFLKAVFLFSPGFLGQWNHAWPWYSVVSGVPAAEILWGGTFGAAWPLMVADSCGIAIGTRSGG